MYTCVLYMNQMYINFLKTILIHFIIVCRLNTFLSLKFSLNMINFNFILSLHLGVDNTDSSWRWGPSGTSLPD